MQIHSVGAATDVLIVSDPEAEMRNAWLIGAQVLRAGFTIIIHLSHSIFVSVYF